MYDHWVGVTSRIKQSIFTDIGQIKVGKNIVVTVFVNNEGKSPEFSQIYKIQMYVDPNPIVKNKFMKIFLTWLGPFHPPF